MIILNKGGSMKKLKVNANLLALLLMISLFAGWEYILLVSAFIWICTEDNKAIRDLTIKAIAIYGACVLFSMAWSLISGLVDLGSEGIITIFKVLNSYNSDIVATDLQRYFLLPLSYIVTYIGMLVTFVILLVKFNFIRSVIMNKPMFGLFGKLNEYVNGFVRFANGNSFEEGNAEVRSTQGAHCTSCGAALAPGAAFCAGCGNKVN